MEGQLHKKKIPLSQGVRGLNIVCTDVITWFWGSRGGVDDDEEGGLQFQRSQYFQINRRASIPLRYCSMEHFAGGGLIYYCVLSFLTWFWTLLCKRSLALILTVKKHS